MPRASSAAAKKKRSMQKILEDEEQQQERHSSLSGPYQVPTAGFFGFMRTYSTWSLGTPEEQAMKSKTIRRDFTTLAIIVIAIVAWSRTLEPLQPSELVLTGTGGPVARWLLAALQLWIIWANFIIQPGPFKAHPDAWDAIGMAGRVCYFTAQCLMLMTAYLFLFPVAVFVLADYRLCAALTKLAPWVTMQGSVLTILFYLLNWCEKKWQQELRPIFERQFPGWSDLMLFTHMPQLLMCSYDFFAMHRSSTIAALAPPMSTLIAVAVVYGVLYTIFIFAVRDLTASRAAIYPFIPLLDTPLKRASFGTIVTAFVLGVLAGLLYLKEHVVKDAWVKE